MTTSSASTPSASPSPADSPALARFKRDAKALLRAWRDADPAADARIRAHHPKLRAASPDPGAASAASDAALRAFPFTLREAQLVVAREQDAPTWAELKRRLTAAQAGLQAGDPVAHPAPERPEDEPTAHRFMRLACLGYGGDNVAHRAAAQRLLQADPALAAADIWTAATAGNTAHIAAELDRDPALRDAPGGPYAWPPLLYACYSRVQPLDPNASTFAVASLLLQRGANANAYFLWDGTYRFTALTGVFGEGESGPRQQPRHPHWRELATLLLQHGADPNDGQACYNQMFTPDNDCLELLLAHGLHAEHPVTWQGTSDTTLGQQLGWAAANGLHARVDLLLAHGAHPNEVSYGKTAWEAAMAGGHLDIARTLAERGARTTELDPVAHFKALAMAGAADAARAMLAEDPTLVQRLPVNTLRETAGQGAINGVRLLLELGVDPNRYDNRNTALHQAAWNGHIDVLRVLIAAGADPTIRDTPHHATPIGWAGHSGHPEAQAYLLTTPIDLFDAAEHGIDQRLVTLLDADPTQVHATYADLCGPDVPYAWRTPLAAAALAGHASTVRLLLARGASPDLADPTGVPLATLVRDAGHPAIAHLLQNPPTTE